MKPSARRRPTVKRADGAGQGEADRQVARRGILGEFPACPRDPRLGKDMAGGDQGHLHGCRVAGQRGPGRSSGTQIDPSTVEDDYRRPTTVEGGHEMAPMDRQFPAGRRKWLRLTNNMEPSFRRFATVF